MRNDYNQPISRARRYELEQQMAAADKNLYREGEKIPMKKWAGVRYTTKSQLQKAFHTEEDIQKFLEDNPQYEINQRFGHGTAMINVEFYERGYAVMRPGFNGRLAPHRWLTPEEVEEYLKDPTA